MAVNLTTTYASQILDLLGLSKFKGGQCPPCPPDKNIPALCIYVGGCVSRGSTLVNVCVGVCVGGGGGVRVCGISHESKN